MAERESRHLRAGGSLDLQLGENDLRLGPKRIKGKAIVTDAIFSEESVSRVVTVRIAVSELSGLDKDLALLVSAKDTNEQHPLNLKLTQSEKSERGKTFVERGLFMKPGTGILKISAIQKPDPVPQKQSLPQKVQLVFSSLIAGTGIRL